MKKHFLRAIRNIVALGDTDIFPFPIENLVFFDRKKPIVNLLCELHDQFADYFRRYPPEHESVLTPVGYNGFRWATQMDPIWNAYFLGIVLSIADQIEAARIPVNRNVVFSYRISAQRNGDEIFSRDIGWVQFMQHSLTHAKSFSHVITCDISDFYPRIGHHRLENALNQLGIKDDVPSRIMEFLSNFSNTRSYGLPIGGPAARILSELVLNQVDRLLIANGTDFCRFADDYHIFTNDLQSAYNDLVYLSEKLMRNEGLALQKSKTRVMSSAEFIAANPMNPEIDADPREPDDQESDELSREQRSLLRFSIRFDPYSPTADDDYNALKRELKRFDIIGLLKSELSKSRIHIFFCEKDYRYNSLLRSTSKK